MSALSQFLQGGIISRGVYSAANTYYPNNVVTYNNSVYICLQTCINQVPTNTTYWDVLSGPPDLVVATSGTGTTPSSFTLTSNGNTITLNKPS